MNHGRSPAPEDLISAYQKMYEHTRGECASCRFPHQCCSATYCGVAAIWAKRKYGILLEQTDHPEIPFMGEEGCIVPPYLRPICTIHTCAVASFGVKPGDTEWTEKYFELRDVLDELESREDVR